MSDGTATVVSDVLRVLVVGDSRRADAAADALSTRLESISIVRERTLETALERLAQLTIHCVVCPFERTGGEPSPLERLRDRDGELPIVAVIGEDGGADGGDAVETALEAGATDVVGAADPPSLVATRIRNAADRYRLETASDRRGGSLLERSDALVWVVDPDGAVETASSAVEPRMGYTPDELERTPLTRLVHPGDREAATDLLETAASAPFGATERGTARVGHADGTWRVYDLTCTNRLGAPAVDGLVLTLEPASVREPDGPARAALDRLDAAVFGLGPAWELRYANAAAERLFDGPADPGTVVWELLDDTVRGGFAERLREATERDQVVEFEIDYPALETRLSVSAHPGPDGVTVYAREATAETAVDRERYALLESVVDALEDGIVVVEGSTVRFANAALFESVADEPLVGRDVDDLFDDELAAAVRERASATVARWMEPLSGTLADDGRAVDVFVTQLSDERTLCVVRDRRRSAAAALSTVGEAIATIRAADSPPAVRRAVVDAALSRTDADLAAWYLVEESALRPAAATAASGDSVDPPPIPRDETDLLELLERESERDGAEAGTAVAFDGARLESVLAGAGIRAERVLAVPVGDRGVVLATSTEPMAFGERDRLPVEPVADAAAIALEALEGASALRSCRTELDALESAVDRCRRLRGIERTLLASETRDEIERTLCDALVSLPITERRGTIELAWVGDVSAGADRITPDARAGRGEEFLESVSVPFGEGDEPDHPAARAATTLEPAVVDEIDAESDADADADGARDWRGRAADRGFRSVMSLPLVVDEFCYGTLTVYADRPSAFDDATRSVCSHLAAVASHAIAGVERKRALLSERVTELEILLRDDDEPLSAIARRLDRRLDVQTVVPRSSAGATVFCTAADVTEDELRDAIEPLAGVESGRLVGVRSEASLLELVLASSTIATTLADHGGVLRSVVPVDDRTRLVVDLSSTVDVRSFVGLIERRQPGAKLVARRERDRSVQPARAFDAELRDRLSERQLRTLETAYYGGFFEWPRESTGEDVADSLGVSQPTFSRHLRLAQRKVFALLFDD